MPDADTHAMQLHLDEICRTVRRGAHAVLQMDRAGWHAAVLRMPGNITPILLPPRSPELNPAENVWQLVRQTDLSNRAFDAEAMIVDACCDAWNQLAAEPWRFRSIGLRDRARATGRRQ